MTLASTGNSGKHVVVIGAGTVGACCAWHLTRKGYQVTVIDPELPGQTTSSGNAGCLSTSHITPFSYPGVTLDIPGWLFDRQGPMVIRWSDLPGLAPWLWKFWRSGQRKQFDRSTRAQSLLMHEAIDDFDEILVGTKASHFREKAGAISIFDSREEFEKELWKYEIKEALGFDWQLIGPSELKIMVPELEIDKGVAVFNADWEHILDPGKMTAHIADASFREGGQFIQDKVRSVNTTDNDVTLTTVSGQQISADALVVAAGVWSNQFASQLDFKVPITAKRGYHSMVANSGIKLDYPVLSMTKGFVMTPMNDGLRVAGTAEFAALDAEPDYSRAKIILKHAQQYLPGLKCEGVTEWMGQRPMMADSIPVISASPSRSNVFYAFGHGHYGLTQGPTTGKIIADLVSGQKPAIDITDYRIERFRS
jgi:D-amino-acid dehydrogenase